MGDCTGFILNFWCPAHWWRSDLIGRSLIAFDVMKGIYHWRHLDTYSAWESSVYKNKYACICGGRFTTQSEARIEVKKGIGEGRTRSSWKERCFRYFADGFGKSVVYQTTVLQKVLSIFLNMLPCPLHYVLDHAASNTAVMCSNG